MSRPKSGSLITFLLLTFPSRLAARFGLAGALSVAIAWLYANANGSLFLTMLMHSAINNTKDIVPSGGQVPGNPFALHATAVGWITVGLLWACAAYFLVRMSAAPSIRTR